MFYAQINPLNNQWRVMVDYSQSAGYPMIKDICGAASQSVAQQTAYELNAYHAEKAAQLPVRRK